MQDNYSLLLENLNRFIRKYYTNRLIRGLIISTAIVVAAFILVNVLEYYLWLSPGIRKGLFYGFIFSSLYFLGSMVFVPLLKIWRISKTMSNEEAAKIIGNHFGEVKDKLLNILQLHDQANAAENTLLVRASIDQKIRELKPVSFPKAIDLSRNKRFLPYLLPPTLVFLFILFAAPSIFKEGGKRLLHNDEFFEKEMPFQINIDNAKLEVLQFENYTLKVHITGNALPADISIAFGDVSYKMTKTAGDKFEYEFVNVQEAQKFHFVAGEFRTKDYVLQVLAKPMITGFEVLLDYPEYTGRPDEKIENTGDISVPEGTRVTWKFTTAATDRLMFINDKAPINADASAENVFTISKILSQSMNYSVVVSKEQRPSKDTVNYHAQVIPDEFPQIRVDEFKDSLNKSFTYFSGEASDDYRLKRIDFVYNLELSDSNGRKRETTSELSAGKGQKAATFTYVMDLKEMNVKPGDKLIYYFEVWDNTGKSSRSVVRSYLAPSLEQLQQQTDRENEDIKEQLEKSIKESAQISKEMKKMQEKLLEKKNPEWEDKKAMQDLMDRQKNLQKNVEQIKDKIQNNNKQQSDFKEISPEIKEKQQMLEKLMDELMNDELKETMKKLEKMLDQMNKQEMLKNLDQVKMDDKKLEKELDRMLELFKKLEQEQKLKETAEKLDNMSKEQEKLSEQSKEKNADNKELKDKQDKLNNKLEDLKKDIADAEKMNEEMEDKTDLIDQKKDLNEAGEEMKKASDQLQKGDKKDASKSQKSAAEKMKDAAQNMRDKMAQMESDETEENMESLRHLMENLLRLSFDEEALMNDFRKTDINNPKYVELIQQQNKIKDDSKMVEDSLYSLAKRVFQLESTITNEISDINRHQQNSIDELVERRPEMAAMHQQYVMTGYNNLALMLSEVFQQMQQQLKEQNKNNKPGSGSCNKPGGKGQKPSLSQLNKMQQQLNDQMQQMSEMMKNGMKPGDKGFNQKVAEMAQQQAAIRQALQEINKNENGDGKLGDMQKTIEQMNHSETELVNKRITEEMLKRQQEITVRLLEFEKAKKERGQEEKREAKTAKEIAHNLPASLEDYLRKKQSEIDLLKTVPANLKPFYKGLVEEYFKGLGR